MKMLWMALTAALATAAVLAGAATADSSSFSETQSPDDQLFHIDVGVGDVAVGTIKISLPGSAARFDPALPIDQSGFSCSVTTSAYGEARAGYLCSTPGEPGGAGVSFPNAAVVHLLSQDCYAPPPQGSAQPALVEVWAAPGDPGTAADASFPIYLDPGCDSGAGEPPVDTITPLRCVVPRLKSVALKTAVRRLKRAGCARGKVTYAFSSSVKKGRVLKQSVKPGRKLKQGSKVRLVVSLGRRTAATR